MSWKGEALAITIERICLDHAESYHKLLDIVGRERKYFSYFEAPALEKIKNFVSDNLANVRRILSLWLAANWSVLAR